MRIHLSRTVASALAALTSLLAVSMATTTPRHVKHRMLARSLSGTDLPKQSVNHGSHTGAGNGAGTPTDELNKSMLALHNQFRDAHQVPHLIYDPRLANQAHQLSSSCRWGHNFLHGVGQNIAAGSEHSNDGSWAAKLWYAEGNKYDYTSESKAASKATGHFTQQVWAGTKAIGCAMTTCKQGTNADMHGSWSYIVCDYSPPGNIIGQFAANVKPAAGGARKDFSGLSLSTHNDKRMISNSGAVPSFEF